MCSHIYPHICSEPLLHLIRLLHIKAAIKPLISVGIAVTSNRYFFNGRLVYMVNNMPMEYLT